MGLIADWPGFRRALIKVILSSESCPTKPLLYYSTSLPCCPSVSSSISSFSWIANQRWLNKMGLQGPNMHFKLLLTPLKAYESKCYPVCDALFGCFSSMMWRKTGVILWAKSGISSLVSVCKSVATQKFKKSSPHVWLIVPSKSEAPTDGVCVSQGSGVTVKHPNLQILL